MSEYMSPAEVARVFRVDPKTVTRWANSGQLTVVKTLGGHRRYLRSEIEALAHPEMFRNEEPEPEPEPVATSRCPKCGADGLPIQVSNPPKFAYVWHCGQVWIKGRMR